MLLVSTLIYIKPYLAYRPFSSSPFIMYPWGYSHKHLLLLYHSRKMTSRPFEKKNSIVLCNKKENHTKNIYKYFNIINTWFLFVIFCHHFCFEVINFSICLILNFIHSFDTNWLLLSKFTFIIFLNRMNFLIHKF